MMMDNDRLAPGALARASQRLAALTHAAAQRHAAQAEATLARLAEHGPDGYERATPEGQGE